MPDPISSTKQERPYILLVAEESALRRSLQLTLRACGYDVRAFASCAHALADPTVLQATCLITDHHMAEMSGVDLLRALRAAGWHRPAILLTTQRAAYFQQQQQALFADILQKPILEHRLCTCVDHATKEC